MATKFDKSKFTSGEYCMYEGKFIARFKYSRKDRAGFIKFLVANFTVEEYLARLENREPPAEILKSKGYISKTVADILIRHGRPVTVESIKAFLAGE